MATTTFSIRKFPAPRYLWIAALLAVAYGVLPFIGGEYLFDAILTPFLALSLAALGLNILAGYTGQVSLGSSAFMAVGAYAAYNLLLRLPGLPFIVDIAIAGLIAAAVGVVFGLPSLRLRGFYLAVSTLATQFFVQWVFNTFSWFSNDSDSGVISVPTLQIAGMTIDSSVGRYLFSLTIVVVLTALAVRLTGSQTGRNFIAVRDHETAARIVGVPVLKTKLIAFAASSFMIGVAGVIWSFAYLRTIEPNGFDLDRSFEILFIIIVGGLASIRGAFFGTALMMILPLVLARLGAAIFGQVFDSGALEMTQRIVIGALIIAFLIAEPAGLAALLDRWTARLLRRVRRQESSQQKDTRVFEIVSENTARQQSAQLVVETIGVTYNQAILALSAVSLTVNKGEIVALLGANGAGKSTTLKAISNLLPAERGQITRGRIWFEGQDVTARSAAKLVRSGIVQVLEGRHCFRTLSVEDNLITGALGRRSSRRELQRDLEKIYAIFPRLKEKRRTLAGLTSGGEQQMTAIGRALMSRPKMLVLDEPSMGLAPMVVDDIFRALKRLNLDEGMSILVAEQNSTVALRHADRAYVIENGRVVLDGPAAELRERDDVKAFYLGLATPHRDAALPRPAESERCSA